MKTKKKRDKSYLLLEEQNLYRAFAILAAPVLLSNLLKSFHDFVDTFFIGRMENSVSAQAAMAISWPLLNICMAFSTGFAIAGVSVISQNLGAGREEHAKKYAGLLLTLSVLIGVVINLFLYTCSPFVLHLMGAKDAVLQQGVTYLRVRSFEMTFMFIFTAFQAVRQAQGDTVTPVILSTAAIVINIVLTGLFVEGFGMGIFGAAFATFLGQFAIAPICLVLLFWKRGAMPVGRQDLRFDPKRFRLLGRLALPSAGSQALSSLGFLILQAVILDYGEVVSAAFSIGNKISNLLLMPIMALGSVLAAFVGQNIGADNPKRARTSYLVSRNLAVGLSIAGCGLLLPVRRTMMGLLTNNADTLAVAVEYGFWVLATQPLMALFQNYLGVFNGSGNTRYSFLVATVRLWLIRLPLILFFKTFTEIGREGIWYAMVISNVLILFYAAYLFRKVDFKPTKGV